MIGTPAVYIAHFPDGTVKHLIYEDDHSAIGDFKDSAEVTLIKVEAGGVEVLNPDTCEWELVRKEEA